MDVVMSFLIDVVFFSYVFIPFVISLLYLFMYVFRQLCMSLCLYALMLLSCYVVRSVFLQCVRYVCAISSFVISLCYMRFVISSLRSFFSWVLRLFVISFFRYLVMYLVSYFVSSVGCYFCPSLALSLCIQLFRYFGISLVLHLCSQFVISLCGSFGISLFMYFVISLVSYFVSCALVYVCISSLRYVALSFFSQLFPPSLFLYLFRSVGLYCFLQFVRSSLYVCALFLPFCIYLVRSLFLAFVSSLFLSSLLSVCICLLSCCSCVRSLCSE